MSRTHEEDNLFRMLRDMQDRLERLERRPSGIVVGSVIVWPLQEPPAGEDWLVPADGRALFRARQSDGSGNPELFEVYGLKYGIGDGSTTFNVPDYRGRFMLVSAQGTTALTSQYGSPGYFVGAKGGSEEVQLTDAQMPSHTHPPSAGFEGFWFSDTGAGAVVQSGANYTGNNTPTATGSAGGDEPHSNMPPFVTVNVLIVAR